MSGCLTELLLFSHSLFCYSFRPFTYLFRITEKKDKKYLRREFSYSKFQQSIILPDNVEKDKITAKVEHGILSIDIPKTVDKEVQKITRTIDIK